MPDQPLVCFVLVNWRTEQYLDAALASIGAQTYPAVKTVLVNNASPAWDMAALTAQPDLQITLPKNLGFAGGNNVGIAAALGSKEWRKPGFICLLNCDARIEPEFIERALEVFAVNPRIGSVVPKLMRDDGTGRTEGAGHQMYLDRTTAHRGHNEPDRGQWDRGEFVFGGSAAAIVYRTAMLEQVAESRTEDYVEVFDKAFFAYYEDVDLDWRAQLAGWQAYYEPRCVAWHHTHGSGGRRRWRLQLIAEKNRYLMLVKNDSLGWLDLGPWLTYEAYHLVKWLLKPWLWPAPLVLLWHLPAAIRKRTERKADRRACAAKWFEPRGLMPPAKPVPADGVHPAPVAGLVSVILLNHNGSDMTRECMQSLSAQTYQQVEVIVVENGSEATDAARIAVEWPGALMLPENHGFAGGVDWGIGRASGEFIALVNNDALLRADCIQRLVESLQEEASAGGVSGRLVNVETMGQARTVITADKASLDDSTLAGAWQESEQNHGLSLFGFVVPGLYGRRGESFYPSGGLCLLRREAVQDMLPELFPQLYFAYHEDVWLGFKLRSRGWRVLKEPGAIAAHVQGSTARRTLSIARLRFLQERNRWLNVLAWYPGSVIARLLPLLLAQAVASCLVTVISDPQAYLGKIHAHLWLLGHPLAVARHRRRSQSGASAEPRKWLSELSGTVRGRGGVANKLALLWCKALGIPHREDSKLAGDGSGSAD